MNRRKFIKSFVTLGGTAIALSKGYSLKFYPKTSKEKWAIIYGTKYGSNRDASIWISEGMGAIANVFDVRENTDLTKFDHLIIGSGIYFGSITKPLESFIKENSSQINKKIRAVFSVCGAGNSPYANNYLKILTKLCGKDSVIKKSFPGRITKKLLTSEDFKSLTNYYKRNNRPFENYDNLRREELLNFGDSILKNFKSS